ncbi:MAG: tetratricopeptide repeat protein [Bacteroidetes bacterium]|nr:tetratricopeptide repeat protein [Bacteroidota bacterium]
MKSFSLKCFILTCLFIFTIGNHFLLAQNRTIDSLHRILKTINSTVSKTTLNDTIRIKILHNLSKEYLNNKQFATAMKYARIAQLISEKIVARYQNNTAKFFLANSYKVIADNYRWKEDLPNALKQRKKELVIREQIENQVLVAQCLNSIGNIYNVQDNFALALESFFKALKAFEKTNDKKAITRTYNGIGIAYARQGNRLKALEYYNKGLKEGEKLKDRNAIETGLINIGTVYVDQGKFEEALKVFSQFLKMAEEDGNIAFIANGYLNIGNVYDVTGKYPKALEMFFNALKLHEEVGSKSDIALTHLNIGFVYVSLAKTIPANKNYNATQAKIYIIKALEHYEKSGQIDKLSYCYEALSLLNEYKKNYQESLSNFKTYVKYKDSILNQANTAKSVRAEMNYEFEKKETITNLQQEKKEVVARQENEKQKTIRNFFIIGFIFMLILAGVIFRSNHQKKQVNELITSQKKQVEEQKFLLEKNQKEIIDSINYAKRIQSSILSNNIILSTAFPQSFILYQPKDIVSGDFYWFYSLPGTSQTIIVVADCTGHGVPGAFLSMVGSTLLNDIVCHKNIFDPAEIIKALNAGLTTTLISKQQEDTNTDGMDISVCKIDSVSLILQFAGANQTLYLCSKNGLEKLNSQIYSLNGVFDLLGIGNFSSIQKQLLPNTSIFMATDGYADQMGEISGKKFLTSRFEKLLTEIHTLNSADQALSIENTFNTWKGKNKQIDDILVIGLKV